MYLHETDTECFFFTFCHVVEIMVGQQFKATERAFFITKYTETRSITETKRQFTLLHPNRPAPSKGTILRNFRKLQDHGTCTNLNKGHSGRPRSVRTPANIAIVQQSLTQNPEMSARRIIFLQSAHHHSTELQKRTLNIILIKFNIGTNFCKQILQGD